MLRVTWPGHVESICVTVIALSLLVKKVFSEMTSDVGR